MLDRLLRLFGVERCEPFDPRSFRGRSPKWSSLRDRFTKEKKRCAISGLETDLEVHHVKPFHLFPDLELEWDNLCLLTRPIHYLVGHCCKWSYYNARFPQHLDQWRENVAAARKAV